MTVFTGTAGNDHFVGDDTGSDIFHMEQGGSDTVECTAGVNALYFGATLDPTDRITGTGGRNDWLYLEGDYSKTVVFDDQTIQGIDTISLKTGYNYAFVTADGNVTAGTTLSIYFDNGATTADFGLNWDGSAETDGSFTVVGGDRANTLIGGAQSDRLTGGAGNDRLVGNGGPDVLNAGAGNDTVLGGAGDDVIYFNPTDQVFGGAGFDALVLFGHLSLTLTHADATSIEEVLFSGDGVARIYSTDDFLAAHKRLIVNAEVLAGDHTLRWFGGAETDGHFKLIGSRNGDSLQGGKQSDKIHGLGGDDDIKGREGKDVISGGAGNDLIAGGRAADMLSGGAGNDTFAYTRASHSTGLAFDTIARFDAQQDSFLMFAEVSQIDPKITKGSLSHDTFDHDLAMATNLAAHHAVLFKPSDGDFAGHIFLVIDQNGVAGYQSGHDVVIELAHAKNMGDFSLGNFV